ncbi:MAG: D-aminoacyl-tRNA deacylase [Bacteroidia bacterium]|nr:D-aminoacyl-tRNA deacylase [Bacteroidia bacterium]MDW8301220.1 D-aminoacyl-tRNA deacylase [Bacteroidia bacterium]
MKMVIQRVKYASVTVDNVIVGKIDTGLLVLVGYTHTDTQTDFEKWAKKVVQMRIFNDEQGKMNLSVVDIKGDILLVSQFTLYADTRKGNRPSYIQAAPPEIAIPLYEKTIQAFEKVLERPIQKGIFGADMKVELLNDGPVTIVIDTDA